MAFKILIIKIFSILILQVHLSKMSTAEVNTKTNLMSQKNLNYHQCTKVSMIHCYDCQPKNYHKLIVNAWIILLSTCSHVVYLPLACDIMSIPWYLYFVQFVYPTDMKLVRKNSLLHSAWVIIAIVLTIIFGAIAVYYWVLFYPILCKKERKYDVMQMSAKP